MVDDEVRGMILTAAKQAYSGSLKQNECPDCELYFNIDEEEVCMNCGLSLDDLCARLERRVT